MNDITKLQPSKVWNYFHEITKIPHPSKNEKKLIEYVVKFGRDNNLETIVDRVGNVIIRKPATSGMENKKCVILQTHLDMVPQKNNDKVHDFTRDPIETIIDGEWVKANGTTLGADNGIGVASTLAILASSDIPHGPLEALFTIDEETGMTGANELEPGLLKGEILLNLDSETEGELCVGCAGGVNVNAKRYYNEESAPDGFTPYMIVIKGLKGGHSGVDIAAGRANSIKLLFRFLMQAEANFGIRIASAAGGDLRNAIPREAYAVVLLPESKENEFESFVKRHEIIYKSEFAETEPDLVFYCEKTEVPPKVMNREDQYRIIRAVFACPHGVQRMSQSMKGLVETSNNLAIVRCKNSKFEAYNLTRSSVDSAKEATAWKIAAVFHLIDAEVELEGSYPGWKPNINSPILKIMKNVYERKYGHEPDVNAVHAGLECGIIGGIYPELDMISLGPTIKNPHSPEERVHIPSVAKFFEYLCEVLKEVPEK
ncbi:MAG TPA: aminoacyl-histidine dipeptidase [Bacteroidales bacterium]|nr:cytosol nonspecific dipeptidase [Bacteroidales bacterium]HRC88996.1 aminoacyl-histidine dipeptidase [Bacteroidales bacterium]